jgi:hypothetical protein
MSMNTVRVLSSTIAIVWFCAIGYVAYLDYRMSYVTLHGSRMPARVATDLTTLKLVGGENQRITNLDSRGAAFELSGNLRCKIIKWAHDYCPGSSSTSQYDDKRAPNVAIQIKILEGAHKGETVWAWSSNIWFGPRL